MDNKFCEKHIFGRVFAKLEFYTKVLVKAKQTIFFTKILNRHVFVKNKKDKNIKKIFLLNTKLSFKKEDLQTKKLRNKAIDILIYNNKSENEIIIDH